MEWGVGGGFQAQRTSGPETHGVLESWRWLQGTGPRQRGGGDKAGKVDKGQTQKH